MGGVMDPKATSARTALPLTPEQAQRAIEAFERVRDIMGQVPPPSLEQQHDAYEAAEAIGAKLRIGRYLADDGTMRWRAGVETSRGTTWIDVVHRGDVDVDDPWQYALSELGLLD